jgi:hypothetical protein
MALRNVPAALLLGASLCLRLLPAALVLVPVPLAFHFLTKTLSFGLLPLLRGLPSETFLLGISGLFGGDASLLGIGEGCSITSTTPRASAAGAHG